METYVCDLEFPRDKNLKGRTYFYAVDFPVGEEDELVVQLGAHRKLQVGKVKRIYALKPDGSCVFLKSGASLSAPPFSPEKLKSAICKRGDRYALAGGVFNSRDLGGMFYDEKHLTAYGNFVRSAKPEGELSPYEFDCVFFFGGGFVPQGEVRCEIFPLSFGKKYFSQKREGESENFAISAFDVDWEDDSEIKVNYKSFLKLYERTELMREIFSSLSRKDGRVLLCDETGSGAVDCVCLVLYLLAGVNPGDIARDYALSDYCIRKKRIKNKELAENYRLPLSEREYLKAIKKFVKVFDGGEEYLKYVGLTQLEIDRLRKRMTCVEF